MTASRANFLVIVALAFITSFITQAFAQGKGPMRLAPPTNALPTTPKQKIIRQKVVAPPMAKKAIEVDSLQIIEPDAAGPLSIERGGFSAALWNGMSRAMAHKMLPLLPVDAPSLTMRNLMRRLLLTGAIPPKGKGKSGSFIALRAQILSDMGDHLGVNDLLNATPGRNQIEKLVRIEADARFLANDNARACALAAEQVNIDNDGFWQKAYIFCQTLSGENQKASLGLALLRELGETDTAFLNLAEALINKELTTIESLPNPSPLHLAMARAARASMPADVISTNRPGVLSAIAVSPSSSVELRLDAAERAEASGALPVDVLRQLYSSVSFSPEDMANPLSKAEANNGPVSRALLYRASLVQTVPTAQAEVLARAFSLARQEGRFPSTARVFLPILKRIPTARELAWFAPDAIRALLMGNDFQGTTPWLSLLQENAMFNKDSSTALKSLMPLVRLANLEQAKEWKMTELDDWWAVEKNKDGALAHAERLYSLFEAMGDTIPARLWNILLDTPKGTLVALPNPAIWNTLMKATEIVADTEPLVKTTKVMFGEQKLGVTVEEQQIADLENELGDTLVIAQVTMGEERLGETIVYSLLALGKGGPQQANPMVLRQTLTALMAAGLEPEARALAVEAALASGP